MSDSFSYGVGRVTVQFTSFLLLPIYTRYLNVHDFAVIELINVAVNFLMAFCTFNISSGVARYYYEDSETQLAARNITAILFILVSIIIFVGILTLFKKQVLQFLELDTAYYHYLILLFPVTLINQHMLFLFQIQKKTKLFSLFSFLTILFVSIITIYFVVFQGEGLDGYMKGKVFGLFLVLAISFIVLITSFKGLPDKKSLVKLLKFSVPSLPGQLFKKGTAVLERQVIVLFIGASMLGNYAITLKLLLPIGLVLESFRLSWIAFVSSTINQENNKELYSKSLEGFVAIMVVLSIPLVIVSKELIFIFAGSKFQAAHLPFGWLLFNTLIGSLFLLNVGLGISEKMKYTSYGTIISQSITVSLYYLLTPYLKIWGLLMSQTLGTLLYLIITYYYSSRFFKIKFTFKKPLLSAFLYIIVALSTFWIDLQNFIWSEIIIFKTLLLFGAMFVIFMIYKKELRLLQPYAYRILFRRKKTT